MICIYQSNSKSFVYTKYHIKKKKKSYVGCKRANINKQIKLSIF